MKKTLLTTLCVLLFGMTYAVDSSWATTPVISGGGGNLTSFSGGQGAINNNAYNLMMNPIRQGAIPVPVAVADFGNCNALILRCASPKCGGSGCVDMAIATAIVSGCVMSSTECKKHGDSLIEAVAASLVASSTAKANAEASAATTSQSAEQIQKLSEQIAALQQKSEEERASNQQQLQDALEQQKQQTEALLASQTASQTATQVTMPATVSQESSSELSSDLIARQQIVGQIMGSLDGVTSNMQSLKKTVQDVLDYAKCDYNATNCSGPRRIATFRKKAQSFFEPYDNVLNSLEDSIYTAMASGVDVTDIYMMMTNSCTQWGKYLCPKEAIAKSITTVDEAKKNGCTLLELYRDNQRDIIQQNFITANNPDDPSNIKLICLGESNQIFGTDKGGIFSRRGRSTNSSNVNVDELELIINQSEPESSTIAEARKMCGATVKELKEKINNKEYEDLVKGSVASPVYAMCTTHIANLDNPLLINNNMTSDQRQDMKDIIAMKSTIIARMLKRQNDYLDATVRQLKIQLQKAVIAGSPSEASTGTAINQLPGIQNCAARNPDATVECLRANYQIISNALTTGRSVSAIIKDQIVRDWEILRSTLIGVGSTYQDSYADAKDKCAKAKLTNVKAAQDCLDIQMSGGFQAVSNKKNSGLSGLLLGGGS